MRVPALAWGPGIKPGSRNNEIVGGLDYMATFAALGGAKLPQMDRAGEPMIFDSLDLSPVLFAAGPSPRNSWFYFTENELSPGAVRVDNFKAVFKLRGTNGADTGELAVDTNLGWKGPEEYVAIVHQIFDLWQDPQERYDIFMTNWTEHTWVLVGMNVIVKKLMEIYIKDPPRKQQSETYSGPLTLSKYERFKFVREELQKNGFQLPIPH